MLLSLFCLLLIVLITGFWTFQGMYSAVIMFGETLVALMLALSFFEPAANMARETLDPELGRPAALMLIFLGALAGLRAASDKLLNGNVRLPLPIDRAGAAFFGFLTGELLIGTTMLATQLLPYGRSVMGFERFDGKNQRRGNIAWFLNPDGLTVSIANMLTDGRFAWGDAGLARSKPDWLNDLHYRRSGPQAETRRSLSEGAIEVRDVYRVDKIQEMEMLREGADYVRNTERVAEKLDFSSSYLVVRVAVQKSVFEPGLAFAQFTPAQFRLVGPRPPAGGSASDLRVLPAVGMSDIYLAPPYDQSKEKVTAERAAVLVRLDADTPLTLNDDRTGAIADGGAFVLDVVFEVPSEDFNPWYIEFKQGARAEINVEKIERRDPAAESSAAAVSPPSESSRGGARGSARDPAGGNGGRDGRGGDAPGADAGRGGQGSASGGNDRRQPPAGDAKVGQAPPGRTNVANALQDRTGETDLLPIPLPKEALAGKLRGGALGEAHVVVDTPTAELPADQRVDKFWVPDGKKMVQVGAEAVFAQSFLGRPLELARSTLKQYHLQTGDGTAYFAIGMYVEAELDGRRQFELQYWPEAEIPERALQDPKRMTRNVMQQQRDYKFGFIFLVDPGAEITHFRTDGRGNGQELQISVSK